MGLTDRFLFLGGPWDQEWHTIGPWHQHPMYRVPVWRDQILWDEVHYYPRRIIVPGWRIMLTVFTVYPSMEIPPGIILPGLINGEFMSQCTITMRGE